MAEVKVATHQGELPGALATPAGGGRGRAEGGGVRRRGRRAHLVGRAGWLHRHDRCDRLLHGGRVSPAAGPRPWVLGVERQLRQRPEVRLRGELPDWGLSDRRKLWRQGPYAARRRRSAGAGSGPGWGGGRWGGGAPGRGRGPHRPT